MRQMLFQTSYIFSAFDPDSSLSWVLLLLPFHGGPETNTVSRTAGFGHRHSESTALTTTLSQSNRWVNKGMTEPTKARPKDCGSEGWYLAPLPGGSHTSLTDHLHRRTTRVWTEWPETSSAHRGHSAGDPQTSSLEGSASLHLPVPTLTWGLPISTYYHSSFILPSSHMPSISWTSSISFQNSLSRGVHLQPFS